VDSDSHSERPWRSGLLGCENLESGRALGKAPTPLLIKGFHLEHLKKSTVERLITVTCGNHVNLGSGAWKHIRTLEWYWKRDVTRVPSEMVRSLAQEEGVDPYLSTIGLSQPLTQVFD